MKLNERLIDAVKYAADKDNNDTGGNFPEGDAKRLQVGQDVAEILVNTEVPENEVNWSFACSGGPGGQHVNKTETKAVAKWDILDSDAFTDEQKERIMEKCANDINKDGVFVVSCSQERSQRRNKQGALEILRKKVVEALEVKAERITEMPKKKKAKVKAKDRRSNQKNKQKKKDRSWKAQKGIDY